MIELNYNLVVMKMFKFLLIPFGVLYYLITSIRNKFYDYKLLKSNSFNVPLIGIGNLSSGGTGKTPMVEYLIRNFSKKYNTVLISRGYKRSTSGYVRATNKSNPSSIGDEPFQIFKKFKRGTENKDIIGSGLGLSIVLEAANAINATIKVKKLKGESVCAVLSLPC